MKDIQGDLQRAKDADEEKLRVLIHHQSPRVISQVLMNPNLTEDIVLLIANRRNIGSEILESIFYDKRWKSSYRTILALSRNPKTPQKISLSLVGSLRVFDLADLTRNQQIPINVRMKAESHILEKILSMPVGVKKFLARRASNRIVMRLIEDGMEEVVQVCLDSPLLTEGDICKVISMKKVASHVIRRIVVHPKWSLRYHVQWVLILNNHTPLVNVVEFLKNMKTPDLRELYSLSNTPISTKPFIYRELFDRGESTDVIR